MSVFLFPEAEVSVDDDDVINKEVLEQLIAYFYSLLIILSMD